MLILHTTAVACIKYIEHDMVNKDMIFDIGLHTGEDTAYYLKNGYKVVAVEANPVLAKQCSQQFASYLSSGQLIILNVGIAEEDGVILPFYVSKYLSSWSSFDKKIATKNNTECYMIEVPCTRQKKIFEEYGIPYYLKVDIEGYDYLSIKDIPATGDKPKYVSFECSNIEWLDILKDKGYTKFKLINQLSHSDMSLAKERNPLYIFYLRVLYAVKRKFTFLPFKYPDGSSGTFGENLTGKWDSYDEIKKKCNTFYRSNNPVNPISWFDFHATY